MAVHREKDFLRLLDGFVEPSWCFEGQHGEVGVLSARAALGKMLFSDKQHTFSREKKENKKDLYPSILSLCILVNTNSQREQKQWLFFPSSSGE